MFDDEAAANPVVCLFGTGRLPDWPVGFLAGGCETSENELSCVVGGSLLIGAGVEWPDAMVLEYPAPRASGLWDK